MSEPTIEEMRLALLEAYEGIRLVDDGRAGYHAYAHLTWNGIVMGTGRAVKEDEAEAEAYRDAYSKLPAKAAPEPTYSEFVGKSSCGCGFVSESLAESGWQELIAHMNTVHPDWNGIKAAPESEDEASPLPVEEKFTLYLDGKGDYIIEAHRHAQKEFLAAHGSTPDEAVYAMREMLDLCARARLDAERDK